MIVVTGVDNTGKTSLVEHLSKKFTIPIAEKFPIRPPKTEEDWNKWRQWVIEQLILEENKEKIYDRLLIDELVYGPVIRHGYFIPDKDLYKLCELFVERQPLFIYTRIPRPMIEDSFNEREQYPEKYQVQQLLDTFDFLYNSCPLIGVDRITFNYTVDPKYVDIDKAVEKYLRRTKYGKCGRLHLQRVSGGPFQEHI